MQLHIRKQVACDRRTETAIRKLAARAFRRLAERRVPGAKALAAAELSLLLTGNKGIRRLNKQWRGKDKATDVLSFPQWTPEELEAMGRRAGTRDPRPAEPWPLGDVVISVEYAREQAAARGAGLREELERLLIHGIVHLLGYDHELGAREARRMRRVERYLLT